MWNTTKTNYGFAFIPAEEGGSAGSLHLWVEYKGVMRYVPTQYEIKEYEWDADSERMVLPDASVRKRKLTEYGRGMERNLRQMGVIVRKLESEDKKFTADDIVNEYRIAVSANRMLSVYAALQATELRRREQDRTARGYLTTVRRFIDFNRGYDVQLDHLTPSLVDSFQRSLKNEGINMQTVSFYMRVLRAIYNKAVGEGLIPQRLDDPFENAYTDVEYPAMLSRQGGQDNISSQSRSRGMGA